MRERERERKRAKARERKKFILKNVICKNLQGDPHQKK